MLVPCRGGLSQQNGKRGKREMEKVGVMTVKGHVGYLGIIPTMLSPYDTRTMTQQLHEGYAHGGGWQPFEGFTPTKRGETWVIQYPEDPPYIERARIEMNGETLVMFEHAWVMVVGRDGKTEIARMD